MLKEYGDTNIFFRITQPAYSLDNSSQASRLITTLTLRNAVWEKARLQLSARVHPMGKVV